MNPLLTGSREALRAIPAETVARGMVGAARRGGRGIYRHTYAAIRQLAEFKSTPGHACAIPQKDAGLSVVAAATVTRRAFALGFIP